MSSKREKEVLLKVLREYKTLPQLWNKSDKDYKNRSVREEAYNALLDHYNKYDPDATLRQLKKKIENLRTNYFKEVKKVNASKLKGEFYVPTLWYYNALSFLGSSPAATEGCFSTVSADPLSYEHDSSKSSEEEPAEREKEALFSLLREYKSMRDLWDKRHPAYKNRTNEESGYDALLDHYKQFFPDATLQQLKRKIEYLRTNYFEEVKKENASKLKGEPYVPTLWYYDALSFLGSSPAATHRLSYEEAIFSLLREYKSMRNLWDKRHPAYKNRTNEESGYDALLDHYKQFFPDATLQQLKTTIEYLRTNYFKEVKKVNASKLKGESYVQTLWYYDALSFLGSSPAATHRLSYEHDSTKSFEEEPVEMSSKREKEVLLKVLREYKTLPQLWNKSDKDYKNRSVREEAYNALLDHYNKYDPDATLRQLKKKIENLRTNYFKEVKKVNASKLKGEFYVPTLWYYNALSFLGSSPAATEGCFSTVSADPLSYEDSTKSFEEEPVEMSETSFEEERSLAESRSEVSIPVKKRKTLLEKENDVLNTTEKPIRHDMYRANKEELEVYGKSIGFQLRDLKNKELTIAQKLIADVIYYAKMGKLTEDAQVVSS